MKKFLAVVAVAGFLTACNNSDVDQTKTDSSNTTLLDSANAAGATISPDTTGVGVGTDTTATPGATSDTATH